MSDDEHEEPSPVTAFLAPLELGQHRAVMKRLGYDNPPGAAPGAARVWARPEVRDTWGCTA